MNYTIGIDLGQVYDYSALAIVERLEAPTAQQIGRLTSRDHHHVRYLRRWPRQTPYQEVVADTGRLIQLGNLKEAVIVLDATGVGREVADLFMQSHRLGRLTNYWPRAYVITGGRDITDEVVPKRELVGKMQTLLQSGRLKVADSLEFAEVLRKELLNFRVKQTATGQETYESAREADHDDLVLAVALACWFRHTFTEPRLIRVAEGVA